MNTFTFIVEHFFLREKELQKGKELQKEQEYKHMDLIRIFFFSFLSKYDGDNSFLKGFNGLKDFKDLKEIKGFKGTKKINKTITKNDSLKEKFAFYKNTTSNIFLSKNPEIIFEFQHLFSRFQKYYRIFSTFSHLYKLKKAKIMVDYDLHMNKLCKHNKYVFPLFQDNNLYLFHICELVKIIQYSISNSTHFFADPLPIKNPYNNVFLNKSALYNIYFFVKFKTLIDSPLFTLFFKTNFDLKQLATKHKYMLREQAIKNFLVSKTNTDLHSCILDMIAHYNENLFFLERKYRITIDVKFPKHLLVKIMKPYLHLYLTYLYSYVDAESVRAENELIRKLKQIIDFNPQFGREHVDYSTSIIGPRFCQPIITYNSKHPCFHPKEDNFLSSHII